MNELEVLEAVEAAKGKQKEVILKEHSNNPKLFDLVDAALNFNRKFHIKKFNENVLPKNYQKTPHGTDQHTIFMSLLDKLEKRELTGHAGIAAVEEFLNGCGNDVAKWYARVIRKDLKADFGRSTAIKAGIPVPKFEVQLAKDAKICKKLDQILAKTVFLSPKLDGYRCIAVLEDGDVTLMSRNGTSFQNFPSIIESLSELFPKGNYVFDGEIMSDDFNSMQQTAFSSESKKTVGDVAYHIFDTIPFDEWNSDKFIMKAGDRYLKLDTLWLKNQAKIKELNNLRMVFHHKITGPSLKEVEDYEKACIAGGYEGCMLNPDIPYYRGKKSNKMLKFKTMFSMEALVSKCYAGKQGTKYENTLGGLSVIQENGIACDIGSGFSDEERNWIWANQEKVIDKILEARYQELTPDKVMRFPIFQKWRPDKSSL